MVLMNACGINKFDKHGNRKGKWKSYWNDKQIQCVGSYKADWQRGVWRYYDQNGRLSQKQVHHPDRIIDITYYFPNGKIECQGAAKIVYNEKENIKYFWFGNWDFYNADGTFKVQKYYLEGQAMEEEPLLK